MLPTVIDSHFLYNIKISFNYINKNMKHTIEASKDIEQILSMDTLTALEYIKNLFDSHLIKIQNGENISESEVQKLENILNQRIEAKCIYLISYFEYLQNRNSQYQILRTKNSES